MAGEDRWPKPRKLIIAEDCAGLGPLVPCCKILGLILGFNQTPNHHLMEIKYVPINFLNCGIAQLINESWPHDMSDHYHKSPSLNFWGWLGWKRFPTTWAKVINHYGTAWNPYTNRISYRRTAKNSEATGLQSVSSPRGWWEAASNRHRLKMSFASWGLVVQSSSYVACSTSVRYLLGASQPFRYPAADSYLWLWFPMSAIFCNWEETRLQWQKG